MVSLLIVSDIRLYRDGLASILSREPGWLVQGTAATPEDALEAIHSRRPDVALVDLALPRSLALVRDIALLECGTKVVALTVPDGEPEVLACAEAGVAGYVSRSASVTDLIATLTSSVRGELLCSPRVAASLLRHVSTLATIGKPPGPRGDLTPREKQIALLLERGCSNKDIARELGIEVTTVKNHVHNLLRKLQVHRRGQAAARVRGVNARQPPPRSMQA